MAEKKKTAVKKTAPKKAATKPTVTKAVNETNVSIPNKKETLKLITALKDRRCEYLAAFNKVFDALCLRGVVEKPKMWKARFAKINEIEATWFSFLKEKGF